VLLELQQRSFDTRVGKHGRGERVLSLGELCEVAAAVADGSAEVERRLRILKAGTA